MSQVDSSASRNASGKPDETQEFHAAKDHEVQLEDTGTFIIVHVVFIEVASPILDKSSASLQVASQFMTTTRIESDVDLHLG